MAPSTSATSLASSPFCASSATNAVALANRRMAAMRDSGGSCFRPGPLRGQIRVRYLQGDRRDSMADRAVSSASSNVWVCQMSKRLTNRNLCCSTTVRFWTLTPLTHEPGAQRMTGTRRAAREGVTNLAARRLRRGRPQQKTRGDLSRRSYRGPRFASTSGR